MELFLAYYTIDMHRTRYYCFSDSSAVKNPPAMQQMPVESLSWEDPLEKEMSTHSSILAWEIPWTEKSGGLVYGVTKESRHK